jgi:hypothetical protein
LSASDSIVSLLVGGPWLMVDGGSMDHQPSTTNPLPIRAIREIRSCSSTRASALLR